MGSFSRREKVGIEITLFWGVGKRKKNHCEFRTQAETNRTSFEVTERTKLNSSWRNSYVGQQERNEGGRIGMVVRV